MWCYSWQGKRRSWLGSQRMAQLVEGGKKMNHKFHLNGHPGGGGERCAAPHAATEHVETVI